MTVNRTPSRRLAFINVCLYLGCVTLGGFLAAPAAREVLVFVREPVSYLPYLQRSLVLTFLEALLALVGALSIGRALTGQRPNRWLSASVYGLLSLLIVYWTAVPPTSPRGTALRPRSSMMEHLNALTEGLRVEKAEKGRYPEDASALETAPLGPSPWWSHGRRLPLKLVSEKGLGARLVGRDGDLAGTIYYVVSATGEDYWLSAVVLDGAPTGNLDFIRDDRGLPVILSSRSSSKRDPNKTLLNPGGHR